MLDMVRRMVWFFIVACAIAYLIFIALGSVIQARALDESRIVLVRDSLAVGEHDLSGMVMVERTCSQLAVTPVKLSDSQILLRFTTWDEPSVKCLEEDTPRPFHAVVFAPSTGVHFTATIDDGPLDISVIQTVPHSSQ